MHCGCKQIDSMLLRVCSVIRSQMTSNCGKNISDTLGYCLMCHLFVLMTYFDVICDLLLNIHTATRNLFVKLLIKVKFKCQ